MTRILVTGASGFLGSHLARRLVADGHTVTTLSRTQPRIEGARAILADLRDGGAVTAAVRVAQPQVVYHLAAQASIVASMRDPRADIETNVVGAVHLARAAVEAGVERFVYTSTGGALYGDRAQMPLTEATPAHPESIYGVSKLTAERYLRLLLTPRSESPGVALSIVRPGSIYGPGQRPGGESGVVAIFIDRMLRGDSLTIYGDGSAERDYIYVDDVVDALLRASEATPATCIIATGVGTSVRTLFDTLARLTAYTRPPEAAPARPGETQRIILDPSRAAALWDWRPRTTIEDGLTRTVTSFRSGPLSP